jgi:hypothetical protein
LLARAPQDFLRAIHAQDTHHRLPQAQTRIWAGAPAKLVHFKGAAMAVSLLLNEERAAQVTEWREG